MKNVPKRKNNNQIKIQLIKTTAGNYF